MAIYQRDFYGLSTYGSDQPSASVEPFVATPIGFNSLNLSWTLPASSLNWTRIQLVRSRAGFPVTPDDGDLVFDTTSSFPTSYSDTGLAGGAWIYYTLFAYTQPSTAVAATYARVGSTSGLSVGDTGTTYAMWNRIPSYFTIVRNAGSSITDDYASVYDANWNKDHPQNVLYAYNPEQFDQPNQTFQSFLSILGWGMEYIRNYQQTLLSANDTHKTHLANLAQLAAEVGIDFEYEVPANFLRSKVQNAGLLARQRGTLAGLQNLSSLSTGWDVDLFLTQNIFLTQQSSEFLNPTFDDWQSSVPYVPGNVVQYLGYIWKCTTAALGIAQEPPTPPTTSNTWWTQVTDTSVTTLTNPATGSAYLYPTTWMQVVNGASSAPILAIGMSDYTGSSNRSSNSLKVGNTSGATHNIDVYGAYQTGGASTPSQAAVISMGIPVPYGWTWDSEHEYQIGDFVNYYGVLYKCLIRNMGQTPRFSPTYWQKVGYDGRPKMGYSFYTHGPFTGTTGTGGVTTVAGVSCYNSTGTLLADLTASAASLMWDSFNSGTHFTSDHTIDVAMPHAGAWTVNSGTFDFDTDTTNNYQVLTAFAAGISTVSWYPPNDVTGTYNIAVTFDGSRMGSYKQSIIFYLTDTSNYYRVTRTSIDHVSAGTPTSLVTLSPSISDGQRVVLTLSTSSTTVTVKVGSTTLGTTTITAPTVATGFGVGVTSS